MTDPDCSPPERDALQRQALGWVMRLASGEATAADAEALHRWRAASRAHRQAFAEANRLWDVLGPAAVQAASAGVLAQAQLGERYFERPLGRRAFFLGAGAAGAAGLAYLTVRPPLGLWPSLSELAADYRTGTGEQRHVTLGGVSLELNTRTSIAARATESEAVTIIELIAGEAAIATAGQGGKPFDVLAAGGSMTATSATFNVRCDGSAVSVTCLDGTVRVERGERALSVEPRQQVSFDQAGLSPLSTIDPNVVTAWRQGLLVFRQEPLARVIDEVNRYRPGRIIIMNDELGRRPVFATFRIDRIDDVVNRVSQVFGARVRTLPGGVVLLS